MADIGYMIGALDPSQFVKGYTIGEELALKKENAAVERAQREAETARIGEFTEGLKLQREETFGPLQREVRDSKARVDALLSQIGGLSAQQKYNVLKSREADIAKGYNMGLDEFLAKSDVATRTAQNEQQYLGTVLGTKNLETIGKAERVGREQQAAGSELDLRIANADKGIGEAADLAAKRATDAAYAQALAAAGPAADQYDVWGAAAKAATTPFGQAYAIKQQRDIASKDLVRWADSGNLANFETAYNRMFSGTGQTAQRDPNNPNRLVIGKRVPERIAADGLTRLPPGFQAEASVDLTDATQTFNFIRQAHAMANIPLPATYTASQQAALERSNAAATRAAGGGGSNAASTAASRTAVPSAEKTPAPAPAPVDTSPAAPVATLEGQSEQALLAGANTAGEAQQAAQAAQKTIQQELSALGIQLEPNASASEQIAALMKRQESVRRFIRDNAGRIEGGGDGALLDEMFKDDAAISDLLRKLMRKPKGEESLQQQLQGAGILRSPAPAPSMPTTTMGVRG